MTQSDVDIDFLNGLQLMIDSMAASHLEKADDPDIPGRFADAPDAKKRISHNGDEEHLPEDRRPLDTTIAGGEPIKYQRNIQNADEDEQEIEDNREVASTDWESTKDLPEADHWCPDVQAWHTSKHEPAKAPSVHVNVDSKEGDEVEKGSVSQQYVDMNRGIDTVESLPEQKEDVGKEYDQNTNLNRHEQENTEDSIAEPFLHRREVNEDEEGEEDEDIDKQWDAEEHEQEAGENIDIAPKAEGGGIRNRQGRLPEAAQRLPTTKHGFAEFDENIDRGEHAFKDPDSYEDDETADSKDVRKSNDGFIDSVEQTHGKAIDILKLWASVDRVLPKTESETVLVNDINILKSFNLDETTNVEDLVTGTLVHKMLIDRASRPTEGWWDSSMLIAKSIDSIDEPAFFSAFLYYEPDTFNMGDFIDIEKAGERSEYSKPQDQEDMPNIVGSPMGGLGLSADDLDGPKDEECDD